MFENIGGGELLLVLLVVFIFFGPKKLPELGKNLGRESASSGTRCGDCRTTSKSPRRLTASSPPGHSQFMHQRCGGHRRSITLQDLC